MQADNTQAWHFSLRCELDWVIPTNSLHSCQDGYKTWHSKHPQSLSPTRFPCHSYYFSMIPIHLPFFFLHVHACTLVAESTGAALSSSSSTKFLCPSLAARCKALRPFWMGKKWINQGERLTCYCIVSMQLCYCGLQIEEQIQTWHNPSTSLRSYCNFFINTHGTIGVMFLHSHRGYVGHTLTRSGQRPPDMVHMIIFLLLHTNIQH